MSQDSSQGKQGLNPNARAFVPKPKPAAPAVPPGPVSPVGVHAPPPGAMPNPADMNPAYQPYGYPPYYPPMYQGQEGYDYYQDEEDTKESPKDKKKESPKDLPKKEIKKKSEPKKEAKKEPKKEVKKEKEKKKEEPKAAEAKDEAKKKETLEEEKGLALTGTTSDKKRTEDDDEDLPPNYTQVDEKRQPLSIVFIGHVDVGKSTICGRIMVITEKVDARTIKKYEQEAKEKNRETWWLAYVMDVNEEERQKGKTVEVGRATFLTETKRYTIFDAPGHQNYVPNMIMGAAMADIGALVIAAKKGEFESGFDRGGQTLEHMLLAKSLGIQKLIVVVNKMDEPSVRWSKERYEQIKADLTPFLNRYGFNIEKNVTWVPLSGLTGANIVNKVDPKLCSWYTGPTLMEILENMQLPERDFDGAVRIPVLDKMKDRGTDIFGKVHSGKIEVGTQLMVMPYKLPAEVSSIQNTEDQLIPYAKAGENVKLRLKGLPNEDYIYKGCLLCSPTDLCAVFQTFIAEVRVVNMLKHKPIISPGYQCVLHLHTLAEECTITKLIGVKGPKDEDFKEVKFAREEDVVKCVITTKSVIAAEKYSVRRQLGRFTLRDEGKTIAIGTVQKYMPVKETPKT